MSRKKITEKLRKQVEQRARFLCEYCQTTMDTSTQRFEVEHIVPISLGGSTLLDNLALSCRGCNSHKHSKTKGSDNLTGSEILLFNPRKDIWTKHFAWDENPLYLIGLDAKGRATISTLKLNRQSLINVRTLLQKVHLHPPLIS